MKGRTRAGQRLSGRSLERPVDPNLRRTEPPTRFSDLPMSAALIAALFFTVALLVVSAYFLMGSVPLLVLKHDSALDARFVRGFFNTYYLAAMFTASATAASFALAARPILAVGAGALALVATLLRRRILQKMDSLGSEIQAGAANAIPGFRRVHLNAILVNLGQLVLIVWTLIAFSQP